jgi:SM-20-related protein
MSRSIPPLSITRAAEVAEALADRGWAILTDLLPPEQVAALAGEAHALLARSELRPAGVGRGPGHAVRQDIRGDRILWLDEHALTPAQAPYWAAIEALRATLNRELYLGLTSFEAHYAVYPPGAHYQKHVDRFSDADERIVSCTFYLNPGWRAEHGGQLRLYLPASQTAGQTAGDGKGQPEDDGEGHIDVLPAAGTCVLFRSDTFPHEVLPATQTRLSVTGWFRRRSLGRIPG